MEKFNFNKFIIVTLLTSIWINASEVFRYFVFVMPRVKDFFNHQDGIAEMNILIFMIWGLWDTLLSAALVFIFWMTTQVYGNNNQAVLIGGTTVWASVFVIFWVATANMGLCDWSILGITLPLSWLEMVIGARIASKLFLRK